MWRVNVPNRVRRSFLSLPSKDQDRILAALDELAADGPYASNIVALLGDEYRKRVGNYRIIFAADTATRGINVKRIARRTSTTYKRR
jgi:mRNA-degrading endonuclease RelE of RelBE toxin-antitoxin system